MDLRVAGGTGLILGGLVMHRTALLGACIGKLGQVDRRVTLQAQRVHVADPQHPRVRGSVRRMAGDTPPGLHCRMLIGKRSRCIHVAFGADRVLVIGRPQLLALEFRADRGNPSSPSDLHSPYGEMPGRTRDARSCDS